MRKLLAGSVSLSVIVGISIMLYQYNNDDLDEYLLENKTDQTSSESHIAAVSGDGSKNMQSVGQEVSELLEQPPITQIALKAHLNEISEYLSDTELDGSLRADSDGQLIIDLDTRDFFDYVLSSVDDSSLEEIKMLLHRMMAGSLPEPAASQARDLLDDYIEFQFAASEFLQTGIEANAMDNRVNLSENLEDAFQHLFELRRKYMTPSAVDAFFSSEEAYSLYTLAQIRIEQDTTLTNGEKAQRIQQAQEELPVELRSSEREVHARNDVSVITQNILASDLSVYEMRDQLSQHYSSDVVDSILMDAQAEKRWQERFADYLERRSDVLQSGLAIREKTEMIEALKTELFGTNERLKLETEESIFDRKHPSTEKS